jgi:hypothetical protein
MARQRGIFSVAVTSLESSTDFTIINAMFAFQVVVLCVMMLGVVLSAPQQPTTAIPILKSAQKSDLAGGYSFR